jgi:Pyruvate/2-oxoacid:ferredoxin oxidoreductase delta subunit
MNLDAEHMIVSIGQVPELSVLTQGLTLDLDTQGGIKADPWTLETSQGGVFSGGDVVKFPGSVVDAIAAGKRAALAIHLRSVGLSFKDAERVIMGGRSSFSIHAFFRPRPGWDAKKVVSFKDLEPLFLDQRPRREMARLEPGKRVRSFQEMTPGLNGYEARIEAERCFYCGLCTGCDRCYLFCPEVSLRPPSESNSSYHALQDYCKGCAVCAAVCPRGVMTMGERR